MYPANFDYVRAETLEQAVALLATHGDDARLLAGGHSLIPMLKLRLAMPETLIDVGRIPDLRGIDHRGSTVRVGALTTHHELATSETLEEHVPILAQAAAKIGDPAVRNKGTIGGNLAHADPASDLPAVVLALGGEIELKGPGGARTVAAKDFFVGLLETDKRDDEILTFVDLPVLSEGDGSAYVKVEQLASGYAVCGAAAIVRKDGSVRLAFNGVSEHAFLAGAVGDALAGGDLSDDAIDAAVDRHLEVPAPMQDVHASEEYRVHLAKVHGKRALKAARDRRA